MRSEIWEKAVELLSEICEKEVESGTEICGDTSGVESRHHPTMLLCCVVALWARMRKRRGVRDFKVLILISECVTD